MAPTRPTATESPIPVARTSVAKISLSTTYAPAPHDALNIPNTRNVATNICVVCARASATQRSGRPGERRDEGRAPAPRVAEIRHDDLSAKARSRADEIEQRDLRPVMPTAGKIAIPPIAQDPVVRHHLREIECKRKEQPHRRLAPEAANLREISGGFRRDVGRTGDRAARPLAPEELDDDRARFGSAPACDEPARRLRHRVANEQDPDGNDRSEPKHRPPRADRQVGEREKRCGRGEDRADVPGCVDQSVDASAISGRDEFSIAELIAPYSPPMPTPVIKRNTASDVKSHAKPVSTVAMP